MLFATQPNTSEICPVNFTTNRATSNVLLHRNGERACLVNLKMTIGSLLACS